MGKGRIYSVWAGLGSNRKSPARPGPARQFMGSAQPMSTPTSEAIGIRIGGLVSVKKLLNIASSIMVLVRPEEATRFGRECLEAIMASWNKGRGGKEGDLEMESEAAGAIAEMLVGADVKGQRSHGLVR